MSDSESDSELIIDNKDKRKRIDESDEKALEQIVFGRESDVLNNIRKKSKLNEKQSEESINSSEDECDSEHTDSEVDEENEEESDSSEDNLYDKMMNKFKSKECLGNVWVDSDDDIDVSQALNGVKTLPKKVLKQNKYKEYLENKFIDLYKTPKWAQKESINKRSKDNEEESDSNGSDESEDELMRTAQNFKIKTKKLIEGFLDFNKCTHLTNDNKMKSSINCVEFHPTSTVAMISSPNGIVRLFQVDGKINAKIQRIQFKDFRIQTAKFNKSGEELIVGSKRESGFFFYYDMIAGKIVKIPFIRGKKRYSLENFVLSNDEKYIASKGENGFIDVLTAKTKEHIFDLKMNGDVLSLGFSSDSNMLLSHGNGGKAYVWDIRKRQCINRFTDEGCVSGTSIAISPDSKYCVTGSGEGVVNIYNFNDILTKSEPKPLKALFNLNTQISCLKFNHSSELLLMSSYDRDNSIRLVHMKSLTVYSNFPLSGKNYGRIYDTDISLNSGYLTFGNNTGTAHLFRLNNFSNY